MYNPDNREEYLEGLTTFTYLEVILSSQCDTGKKREPPPLLLCTKLQSYLLCIKWLLRRIT
ncbi:hypothetical protein LA52FAK_43450 [Desulforhopalus sp. 52FAK]